MAKVKQLLINIPDGRATGAFVSDDVITIRTHNPMWKIEERPILAVMVVDDLQGGVVLASEDGETFKITFGLCIDGKRVDVRELRNKSEKEVFKIMGIDSEVVMAEPLNVGIREI